MVTEQLPSNASLILMIYGHKRLLAAMDKAETNNILIEIERAQVVSGCCSIVKVETTNEAVDWIEQFSLDVGAKYYQ